MGTELSTDGVEASNMLPPSDDEGFANLHVPATLDGSDHEQMSEQVTNIRCQHGLLSTLSSIRVESFRDATGCRAGAVLNTDKAPHCPAVQLVPGQNNEPGEIDYYPFKDKTDYAFALWLHRVHITKGNVDAYFKDPRMAKMYHFLGFKNATEWLGRLHQIPYGIGGAQTDLEWTSQMFTVEAAYDEMTDREYVIQYRDVVDSLRFLLGHQPFRNDLVYAPVRHYNGDDKRVYSEMHTADWWWETQKELPDGATLVPLLISTDKTALTQHQGDLAAWPIYLTIGNLNRQARRSQSRPGLVLLGFLPVVENDGGNIKARVWHMALSIILKR